jgi:hypothetical protein
MKKVNLKELALGVKLESENDNDQALAQKVAAHNIEDDPRHYSKLQAAGLEGEPEVAETDIEVVDVGGPTGLAGGDQQSAGTTGLGAKAGASAKSSGLGNPQTQKPLTSDNLNAPKVNVVNNKNTVASTKTPSLQGSSITTGAPDQLDHFCGQIGAALVNLDEGGAKLKKK